MRTPVKRQWRSTPNAIHIACPASAQEQIPPLPTTHLILIPGNPGLAEYYGPFLAHLSSLLNQTSPPLQKGSKTHQYTLTALTLAGFPTEINTNDSHLHGKKRLFNPEEQSQHITAFIDDYISNLSPSSDNSKPRVILLGHSIGSYLLLQHLNTHLRASRDHDVSCSILGGILLFPTIIDLAKSSNGQNFGWLIRLFATYLGALVGALAWFAAGGWCAGWEGRKGVRGWVARNWINEVEWVLCKCMSLDWRAHGNAIGTTRSWLGSGWGVWETLYLARDELRTVTTDKWDDLVWGSAAPAEATSAPRPRLFFYFAQKDHWVADRTRDDLMRVRGWREGEDWRPRMEIAEAGIGHAFCLRQSEVVAEKVAEYVRQIVEAPSS